MTNTTTYWRSLEQLEQLQDPGRVSAAAANEFADGAAEPPVLDDVSRRRFLGIGGAIAALAGMTSCRKPVTHIIPFARRPEDLVPGNPRFYATAHVHNGIGIGTLVKSSDGRPTKVEGNPLHPSSLGGSNHLMQAELLNMYDPARSKHPVDLALASDHAADDGHDGPGHPPDTIEEFADYLKGLKLGDGTGLRVLATPTNSPSVEAGLSKLAKKYPKAVVHTFAPVNQSASVAATTQAFGNALDAQYDLAKADVVVSFDCDFQSQDGAGVRNARDFASRRRITAENEVGKLARLYVVESYHSVTGSNSDHRFRARPSQIVDAAMALAGELKAKHGLDIPGDFSRATGAVAGLTYGAAKKQWIPILARDLAAKKGKCAIAVGPRLPVHAQVVLHAINKALGATVTYTATPRGLAVPCDKSIAGLATAMDGGSVSTLVVLGGNPVYDAPADIEFGKKLAKVKNVIHLSMFNDETSSHETCSWHVNQTHDLEAWGDIRAHDGTATIQQPLIAPLYHGISTIEMLALLTDGMVEEKDGDTVTKKLPSGYEIIRQNWKPRASGSFDTWWSRAVHDGVVPGTKAAAENVALNRSGVESAAKSYELAPAASLTNLEVQFRPSYNMHDGRYANNSWLAELPDPMTKITWDNAAIVSLNTLNEAKLSQGDLVDLTLGGRTVQAPVWVLPGHADHTVTLTLGWGRKLGDGFHAANGTGFDAYTLRSNATHDGGAGLKMSGRKGSYTIAVTQEHGTLEGRDLVREASAAAYTANPKFAKEKNPLAQMEKVKYEFEAKKHDHDGDGEPDHAPEEHGYEPSQDPERPKSLWGDDSLPEDHDYTTGNQWGMVIDLNTCIGCNACMSACVSENNIAVVGKEQIKNGREMFWNRIDRYFGNEEDGNFEHEGFAPKFNPINPVENPKVVHQMVPCMQCEKASCEVVCPVAATTHSPEGLNDMAYNRCIGTRYCGNNCPYKVRRFNYLDYHGEHPETIKMTRNPDVTVRSRGVMEKCTYCTQRINRVKIEAKKDGRRDIRDGEIQTACEQSCPTQAITFGNINDTGSRVAKLKDSNLNYAMLAELNMRPRTTYLAKIRNPNPELINFVTTISVIDEPENPQRRAPLVEGPHNFATVTETVSRVAEQRTPKGWYLLFGISVAALLNLGACLAYLFWTGVGIWGNNSPAFWGWPIVNFVFWIGIGHAGTLISAILFLFRQKWRTAINRASEAMTIFAVMAAGLFPAIHVGRIWVIYWVYPLPNQMSIWPNFKSPLLWDVFAVSTYFTVSALFWYVGLVPDLATFRDRAKRAGKSVTAKLYGFFALGWHGGNRHWLNYEKAYMILAGLSTPLVLSVHSIVSFDFAVSKLPGWHTTIFPPYFVAGAIFSGFGMVLTLMIPARKWLKLHDIITLNHLDNIAKILLLTGTLVGYAYSMEFFIAWYSGAEYEQFAFMNRAFGPFAWAYWIMIFCNVVVPQIFWMRKMRRNATVLFIASIFVNIGMWFERFVIICTTLVRDFVPANWSYFTPTLWDVLTFIGSWGLFLTMFLLFCRFLPVIALSEVKGVMPDANPHPDHASDSHDASGQPLEVK